MKYASSSFSRQRALLSFLAISVIALPAYGHRSAAEKNVSCAEAASGATRFTDTVSSAAEAQASPSLNGERRAATGTCVGAQCRASSTVTTGPGGLSGSTTLPDGSSVTIHAQNGVTHSKIGSENDTKRASGTSSAVSGNSSSTSSTSTATSGTSTVASGVSSSASSSASSQPDSDCSATVDSNSHQPKRNQHNRTMEK